MAKKFRKITVGFVVQEFDENGLPVFQEFISSDEVNYENEFGEHIPRPDNEEYLPYHMVQPEQ
jgi:hypothetical protein